jgi:hypothetical protein
MQKRQAAVRRYRLRGLIGWRVIGWNGYMAVGLLFAGQLICTGRL